MPLSTFGYDADRVRSCAAEMRAIDGDAAHEPRKPGAWSRAQIVGHLIDSACNNHRRFVVAQQTDDLVFDGYDHTHWAACQGHDRAEWAGLVDLWEAYNLHLLRAVGRIGPAVLDTPRREHTLDAIAYRPVPAGEPATLGYLIEDYYAHLDHHMKQVLGPA